MSAQRFGPVKKAVTLVPLALLSTAWTASLAGVGSTSATASDGPGTLPDGTTIPTEAIEDPASYTRPGSLGLGVPEGATGDIVASSSTNGIPSAALAAYQRAETVINAADAGCNITWQLIAAIGRVESDHGRYGGNSLGEDGVSRPGIYGIALDGTNNTQAIEDTDAGQYDNDARWDRAVGPMQFIPSTWSVVGVDADGDAKRDPQDIDDAALASAVYLCSGDDDLSTDAGRREAVFRYNHSEEYVDLVLRIMEAYLAGDYTSAPNSSTSAVYLTPDYDTSRPVLTPAPPKSAPATGGPGAPSGDGESSSPGAPTAPTPDDGDGDDVAPPPAPTSNDPVDEVEETVKDTVKDPVKPVVDVLTYAEALTLCRSELSAIPDPLGLLSGAAERCASRVEGETRSDALAIIPNTLDGVVSWLGL